MRGIFSQKTYYRKEIFTEIARLAYEGGGKEELEALPYKIVPGEMATIRQSIFLERAVVGERLRVAMGMSCRTAGEYGPISQNLDESMVADKYYEPPLIDVIKFACHRCPEKRVFITNACQGCIEHPCHEVCPKNAITVHNGDISVIDQNICIKCGKCADACPYNAIIRQERPCERACGMGAIHKDGLGRAEIDQNKCVSCGQCLVNCPFSAIVDKGQIYQTIRAMQEGPVYAIVAPSIAGQFGPEMTETRIRSGFKALGFTDVAEVAVGADLCTIQEAKDFLREVPDEIPFMGTSCCPSWSVMVKKQFPQQAKCISMALTPMVLTARLLKKEHPEAKVCFVGPCAAKKLEASRRTVKSYVDFVLTFEELAGMFNAKEIEFAKLPEDKPLREASADGRGFASSGGVAKAVVNYIRKIDPERTVNIASAEGLAECKKLMLMAKAGKYNGYLLEGMACPGGCIAGAGTIRSPQKAKQALEDSQKQAAFEGPISSGYADWLPGLEGYEINLENAETMNEER